jgi:hypothetical protein
MSAECIQSSIYIGSSIIKINNNHQILFHTISNIDLLHKTEHDNFPGKRNCLA